MEALACFHNHGNHILARFLKPGFRHVFVALQSGKYWIRIDALVGRPVIEVVCSADYDLATFYRQEGFTVVETRQGAKLAAWPLAVVSCVGIVKAVLCLNAPLVVTPYQLYRRIA